MPSMDAVIISGERRGEIVTLPSDIQTGLTDTDVTLLNSALDDLLRAIDGLQREIRATTAAVRDPTDRR